MNNLIKDKITIIIPNQGNKNITDKINQFKIIFKNIIHQIIVISQEDNKFNIDQLYNIGFNFVQTRFIMLVKDDEIYNIFNNNEIELYKNIFSQISYKINYSYYKDNILYIGVNNIQSINNSKYYKLYNSSLNNDNKEKLREIEQLNQGVSICITAYKSQDTIKDTLDSVIRQSWFKMHDNYEILLGIDNCQKTLDYVKTIMNNYKNLRVFMMNSNKGTYVTTNTLMKIAKYENLIRFDSDDIMCPNMVEILMENYDKCDIQRFRFAYLNNKWKTTRNSFGQIFIKKAIFDKFGGFRDWKCAADYEFYVRTLKFVNSLKLEDKYLFYYRISDNSLTHSQKTGMRSEYRKQLHDFIKNQEYNVEEDAIIECVTNKYREIFSNIQNMDPDDYITLVSLNNDWSNIN